MKRILSNLNIGFIKSFKNSNFNNYRFLEGLYNDFKEQEFLKDSQEIYFEIVKARFLNEYYILLRSISEDLYKVRINFE